MKEKYYIEIKVTNGAKIRVCLETKYAPKTVENFVKLVEQNYFDGTIFHRVIHNFMIQTGGYAVVDNSLTEMPEVAPIEGEFASNGHPENTLHHELGVISMARTSDKNSGSSQFFLCSAECGWLDGEYAAFGYAIDDESKQAILEISAVETCRPHPAFADFPVEVIGVESIRLIDGE